MKKPFIFSKILITMLLCGFVFSANALTLGVAESTMAVSIAEEDVDTTVSAPSNKNRNLTLDVPVVYPNPAYNTLNVEMKTMKRVEIVDMMGRIVIKKEQCNDAERVDITNLKEGLYFVRVIKADNRASITKFIKK